MISSTDASCRLPAAEPCRCGDYAKRKAKVPDCVRLTPQNVARLPWLPPTCGYRLVAEGRDLYWWHPLVSGDPESVHAAGVSVRGRVGASEDYMPHETLEDRIVNWPLRVPKRARARKARGGGAAGGGAAPAAPHQTRPRGHCGRAAAGRTGGSAC